MVFAALPKKCFNCVQPRRIGGRWAGSLPLVDAMRDNTIVQSKCRLLDRWSGRASFLLPLIAYNTRRSPTPVQVMQYSYSQAAMTL
jgi:hypothetical protein